MSATENGIKRAIEAYGGDPEQTICFCHNVPLKRLLKAIQEGSDTLEKIQVETCASTGCGGCEPDVREILRLLLERK